MALLAALLARPGEVITKTELMDAAWEGLAVEESNLSVQIATLRKAIGSRPDGSDWIVTIPRVGYRFVPPTAGPSIQPAKSYRKTVAVVPFVNLSADPEQDYFADGLAEEIIIALSKVGGLQVTARNSSFAYRGTATDVRVIGTELNVGYVLEGSVRRSASRIRVAVQLADTANGEQIWAERYDRELTDLFAVQDAVTRQVVAALRVTLKDEDVTNAPGTDSVPAFELYMRGRAILSAPYQSQESFRRGSALLEQAIALDPSYARAHAQMALALAVNYLNRWTGDGDATLRDATAHAERALALDPRLPFSHGARSLVAMMDKDGARMASEAQAALGLDPDDPMGHSLYGGWLMNSGRPLEAIPVIERLIRLDPAMNPIHLNQLATAYLLARRYETAAALFRERIALVPETDTSRGYLVSALAHLGRMEEARAVWSELMQINPAYRMSERLERMWFQDRAEVDHLLDGLRKAGVPEDKL